MVEPFGLAVNIYTAFKEVYLVSKFIHRTVLSAKNHSQERRELRLEFEIELLFLQSLGRLYLAQNRIVDDPDLNQRWLNHVYRILERMRLLCGDYARIAAEDDDEYKRYSPYMNRDMYCTKVIEFDINETLPSLPEPSFFSKKAFKWLGIGNNKSFQDSMESWKWALVEKKKFEDVLRKFQKLNGKLKELLPLFSATQSQSPEGTSNENRVPDSQDENAQRLGIAQHERLRELSNVSPPANAEFFVKGVRLETGSDNGSPVPGHLLKGRSRSASEKVLVEYKDYPPSVSKSVPDIHLQRPPVQQLANLLRSAGLNGMLTLPLRGVIEQAEQHRYAFIFNFPSGVNKDSTPVSLVSLIEGKTLRKRLNLFQRFAIAQQIARSIGAFHADGWVHKSMRSSSVVFFHCAKLPSSSSSSSSDDLLVHSPYLVNFEYSRPETAMTKYDFDDDLERDLYRHPDRQGRPKITFSKIHDIYALGVVLLEIGLWDTALGLYQRASRSSRSAPGEDRTLPPASIRQGFIEAAKQRLGHHMGQGYTSAVLACLTGKFDNLTSRADFPMMFHEEVIERLDIKKI